MWYSIIYDCLPGTVVVMVLVCSGCVGCFYRLILRLGGYLGIEILYHCVIKFFQVIYCTIRMGRCCSVNEGFSWVVDYVRDILVFFQLVGNGFCGVYAY